MRRQLFVPVVLLAVATACSDDGSATDAPAPTSTTEQDRATRDGSEPTDPGADDAAAEPDPDAPEIDGDEDVDRGEPVTPFESEATTPAEPGVDIDDVLRDEQAPGPTTIPHSDDEPIEPLDGLQLQPIEAGPLAWTLRHTPTPEDQVIELLVDERGCDGALAPDQRLAVEVQPTPDRVVVDVARIAAAPADRIPCPTAPLTPVSVALDEPLGGRRVLPADGSAGPAFVPTDDVAGQLSLRTTSDRPVVAPVTTADITDTDFVSVLDCAAIAAGITDWRPTTEYRTPELVLAEAADVLGPGGAPWHEFVVDDGDDRGLSRQWVVVVDGAVVARAEARRGVAGWTGAGSSCVRDDARPFDSVVDPAIGNGPDGPQPVVSAVAITAAALAELPGLDGLALEGESLRFADVDRRCPAWGSLEDALAAAGYVVGPERTVLDPAAVAALAPGTGATEVMRQLSRRVDGPDGTAALLTTTADGSLVVSPVASRPTVGQSRVRPCRLDGDAAVLRIVVI